MRRRKKIRRLNFKIIILLVAFFSVISFSYAYLSTSLNIRGKVSGGGNLDSYVMDAASDNRLSMSTPSRTKWYNSGIHSYSYSFSISNITSQNIPSFNAVIEFNVPITSVNIWNYDYEIQGNKLIIKDVSNSLAGTNKTAQVAFQVSSESPILAMIVVKLEGIDASNNTIFSASEMPVDFSVATSWGNYVIQYNVTITNKTNNAIMGWSIEMPLPEGTSRSGGWNAEFTMEDQTLVVSNLSYNAKIEANNSISFGLQLNTNISGYIPTVSMRKGR